MKTKFPFNLFKVFHILVCITLGGCSNNLTTSSSKLSSPGATPTSTSSAKDLLSISTVNFGSALATAGAQAGSNVNIFFNTTTSTVPVTSHCNVVTTGSAVTSKPCNCQFNWTQVNSSVTSGSSVPRTLLTSMTNSQGTFISCAIPTAYTSGEIPDGTQIKISVVAAAGNPDTGKFTSSIYNYTKGVSLVAGSFQDSQGHVFENIVHYSCYQSNQRGLSIQSKLAVQTNPTTGATLNAILGTQFCVAAAGQSPDATTCPTTPTATYSAEAYYYNLFVPSGDVGDINQYNANYVCPTVNESLNSNSQIGTNGKFWPMDSTFALSLASSSTFTIGVVGNSTLSTASSAGSTCFPNGAATALPAGVIPPAAPPAPPPSSGSLSSTCLGFAAPVNTDSTCPSFRDSSGLIHPTFRLRRYIAIYPRFFDTGGKVMAGQTQGLDTIYVLDRPVQGPSTANPTKPYTMLGPKPCPMAYFDSKGVATGTPGYFATSNSNWAGKNIDGIEFPNHDSTTADSGLGLPLSCSTSFPVLSPGKSYFTISTVNRDVAAASIKLRHVYVRPKQPFTPHYEEDTSFQACAPQASPFKDPPLHFVRDTNSGRVAWCAESYPTQNYAIQKLDAPTPPSIIATGNVAPFTSHVVANSASASCNYSSITIPTTNYSYPAGGVAHHPAAKPWGTSTSNKTCDRTVVSPPGSSGSSVGVSWPNFPLLASSTDIESSLSIMSDSSYMCLVTYDNNGAKSATATQTTPKDGCCNAAIVSVPTSSTVPISALNGHLEPDIACGVPNY